jgi:hypothetical protein
LHGKVEVRNPSQDAVPFPSLAFAFLIPALTCLSLTFAPLRLPFVLLDWPFAFMRVK